MHTPLNILCHKNDCTIIFGDRGEKKTPRESYLGGFQSEIFGSKFQWDAIVFGRLAGTVVHLLNEKLAVLAKEIISEIMATNKITAIISVKFWTRRFKL